MVDMKTLTIGETTFRIVDDTAEKVGTAATAVSQHNTAADSHGDIRLELKAINDRLTAFFDSDDQTLDELSEIVAYITSNKTLIESITTSKVSVSDIINNLSTNVANKPLSAAQGVALKGLIDTVSGNLSKYALASAIPTKVSQLENDKKYLTEHQDISHLLPRSELPEAVNDALAQAKESGEFDGASVTVKSVTESTEDGGSNVVKFSDGKSLTVKNGRAGKDAENPDAVPDYWQSALDEGVAAINTAVESAGRNKSAFFFYTDAHWGYGSGRSPALLKYLGKHTAINKTIFGGDFGNTYEHPDTGKTDDDWMDVMRTWKLAIRDIPSHHSVVGNHDKDIPAISTDKGLYGFLFAPEESNDIVRGGDFFYYIDDVNEKTRYFYLNTGLCNFSDEQCAFLIDGLTSVPSGWHIVAVSHIWFVYDDTSAPTVGSVPPGIQNVLNLLDAYNARETGTMTIDSAANSYDFSACEGWVEFCIGGHTHVDYNFTSESGIPVILCQTDSYHTRGNYTFAPGTTTESAVSGIVADYDAKKISVIRVGRGESSDIAITTHVVTYTNVIKTSIDKDGNIFNGGKGWADNSRIGSGGIYLGNGTAFVTGHIPVTVGSDLVIRLRNVTFDGSTHNNYMYMVAAFDAAFARVNFNDSSNAIYPTDIASNTALYSPVLDGTNIVEFKITPHILSNTDVKYIAICCSGLSDASIITINEPID